jgi:uncharacterized membrane protein YphA (DoxX/SURF4 family)
MAPLRRLSLLLLGVALAAQGVWTIWQITTNGFSFDAMWRPLTYSIPFLLVAVTQGNVRALNALGRVMIAIAFLLALWSRFSNFSGFIRYTGTVLSFMPDASIPLLAVAATICEVSLCAAMFVGFKTRWASAASAVLLLMFATSMVVSGLSQFEWAVYVLSAGAFVLATADATLFSVDAILATKETARPSPVATH